ncbi:flagellar assembly protein FliH [Pseudomonas sp. Q1-7]|uniref:flagellar assembly protein FliH n=1 Tax=Pseudomonas sp. Q1-7 TaxID=3020843 RepID=UPI0023009A77|nr:flagellar assembly protein FliH [Pseudomonas sp. Q1-7]
MTVRVIKSAGTAWRAYRFPPRSRVLPGDSGEWDSDPAARQRAVAEGFQEGIERGYQDGLNEGREAGQREGMERGRQEGQRLGREEGRTLGQQQFEEASRPLQRVAAEYRQFLQDFEQARRQQLLELVKKVSKQVIRCELTLHPTQLLSLAEEALAAMPGDPGEVQILLNPEECARIRDLAPDRAEAWRLVPDERLALGECRVVTAQAEADIGCQQRLDSCMDALAGHLQGEE